MINPLAKVYSRGKVIPDKTQLEELELTLNENGELINISTRNVTTAETEVEGYVCILNGDDEPSGIRVPMKKTKFKKGFRFMPNGPNTDCFTSNNASIVTFEEKIK